MLKLSALVARVPNNLFRKLTTRLALLIILEAYLLVDKREYFSKMQTMTMTEALKCALTILKQVMEEKLSSTNVEVAAVTPTKPFHMYSKEQVEDIIKELA